MYIAALHNICSISFSCLCGPNTQGDNFLQQTLFTWNFISCFNSSHFWPGFLIFCPDYAISSPECPLIFNRTICKWPSKKKDFWSTNNVASLVQNDQQTLQINFISFYKVFKLSLIWLRFSNNLGLPILLTFGNYLCWNYFLWNYGGKRCSA